MRVTRWIAAVCLLVPAWALADYNMDGSKYSEFGTADIHFSSLLYSDDQLDAPVSGSCADAIPFEDDGVASTLGAIFDAAAYSGGQIDYQAHVTGTLNTTTGAFVLEHHASGLSEEFQYDVPGIGTLTFVLTDIDMTLNATLSGHNNCFINGQWRDAGATYTTNPATSIGVMEGYIDVIGHPRWTLTINDIRVTGSLCSCPGVWIRGSVALEDYGPSPNGLRADITVRDGARVEEHPNTLLTGATGAYLVQTHIDGANVEVLAKVSHWLRGTRSGVNTLTGDANGVDFSLTNGDADGNNAVELPDLNAVLLRFGLAGGNEDLDGDGLVGLPDLNLTLLNFGLVGEE